MKSTSYPEVDPVFLDEEVHLVQEGGNFLDFIDDDDFFTRQSFFVIGWMICFLVVGLGYEKKREAETT